MGADGQTLDFREEDHTSIQLNILTSKKKSIFSLIFTETPCNDDQTSRHPALRVAYAHDALRWSSM